MKKRIWSVILALSMVLSLVPVFSLQASAAFSGGTGTSDDPYLISSVSDLNYFNSSGDKTKCYALTTDIALNGTTGNWTAVSSFSGTFDGRNHTISGYDVRSNTFDNVGFFQEINDGHVLNLHLKGYVESTKVSTCSGGLAGFVGGISIIENCSFDGTVAAHTWGGGLIGDAEGSGSEADDVTIKQCYVTGSIQMTANKQYYCASPIVPFTGDTTKILQCYSDMGVSGSAVNNKQTAALVNSPSWSGTTLVEDCFVVSDDWDYSIFTQGTSTNNVLNVKKCHIYSTVDIPSHQHMSYSGDNVIPTAENVYQLYSTPDTPVSGTDGNSFGVIGKDATQFRQQATFEGWDFDLESVDGTPAIWRMGSDYPVLMSDFTTSHVKRDITYSGSDDNTDDLSKYILTILDTDPNHATSNRFKFSDASQTQVTLHDWDSSNWQWNNRTTTEDLITSISGDTMTLNPDAPEGDYTVTIRVEDDTNVPTHFNPYEFDLKIRKKKKVPVPEITPHPTPRPTYSPSLTLDTIKLTEGWKWDDTTQVPKNGDGDKNGAMYHKTTYDIFYPFDTTLYYAAGENYTKYYDLTDLQTAAAANGWTLSADNTGITLTALDPEVEQSNESPYVVKIRVLDRDTGNPVSGATVSCITPDVTLLSGTHHYPDEFPKGTGDSDTTDSAGEVYAELSPGDHKISVITSKFPEKQEIITVDALDPELEYIIYLDSPRYTLTIPDVVLKSDTSTVIPGAQVTFTKVDLSDPTAGWNNGDASYTGASGSTFDFPVGIRFKLVSSTYGYTTDDVLYMKIEADASAPDGYSAKFYTNAACTDAADRDYLMAEEMSEPYYKVTIDEVSGSSNPKKYTATITLKNIKATHGAFGLKYDPEIFDFTGTIGTDVTLGANIGMIYTAEELYTTSQVTPTAWTGASGYYDFEWAVKQEGDAVLNTELSEEVIATLTFSLKNDDDAGSASVNWFDIELWGDTQEFLDYKTWLNANYYGESDLLWQYWRVLDDLNDPALGLGKGRIDKAKDVVNDVHKGGFFQACVSDDLASTNPADFYDVMTIFDYKIDLSNSVLKFHTYDKDDLTDLDNAGVTLYNDLSPTFMQTKTTAGGGIASFYVDTTNGVNGEDFTYTVTRKGYWSIPESGLSIDRPSVHAPSGVVTKVNVPMEKKIYHVPMVLDPSGGSATLVQDADLGGEKYAYNGRAFHFRAKAGKGYKITSYPTEAEVYIYGADGTTVLKSVTGLTPVNGLFTLDASYLDQQTLKSLTGTDLTDIQANADYNDAAGNPFDPTAQPDDDGFRSFNVYIKFIGLTTVERQYIVEAVTNANGAVTGYTYDSSSELPLDTGYTVGSTCEYARITTTTSTISPPANRKTGTFTFTAGSGNVVDKVYINGLLTHVYDGDETFTYTFGDVDMDCNITVLFTNGNEPATDKIMTLVVGDYGEVDTTQPNLPDKSGPEEDLSITRRVYLNPQQDLVFTATPTEGYVLYKVQKEIVNSNGTSTITDIDTVPGVINATHGPYTFSKDEADNVVVYVTFKHPDASTTPSLFVKSYVYAGKGVVKPAGILVYAMFDTVDIDLTSTSPYTPKGVVIQPFDDLTTISSTYDFPTPLASPTKATYTYPVLKENIAIGAVFAEPEFSLSGKIDLSQASTITTDPCQSGAVITFVRLLYSGGPEKPAQIPYTVNSTNSRTNATFTVNIPAGFWNVYITKPGYLDYNILNFEMKSDGSTNVFGDGRVIIPYIGSTTGTYISVNDAGAIMSGWRTGVNSTVKGIADVDNDGTVSVKDISYVWHNYNERYIKQQYSNFKSSGSPTVTGYTN